MGVDLLFSQSVAPNPSTGIQSDRIGTAGADRSGVSQKSSEPAEFDRENFLSTLKQATQSRNSTRCRDHAAESQSAQGPAADAKIDDPLDYESSAAGASLQTEWAEHPDPAVTGWNLTTFIKLLENLGFIDAAGTAGEQALANANQADSDPMAVIESLITRIQQHPTGQAADLKFDLEMLQQSIAAVRGTGDGVSIQGHGRGLVNELAQIKQWLTGLMPGIQGPAAASDSPTGPEPGAANVSAAIAADAEGAAGTAAKSPVANGDLSGLASGSAPDPADARSQSEPGRDAKPKSPAESQAPVVNKDPHSQASPGIETTDLDAAKTKAAPGSGGEPRAANSTQASGRMGLAADPDHPLRQEAPDRPAVKAGASPASLPADAKMSGSQVQNGSDSVPLSKIFQEIQGVKDGGLKTAVTATEEVIGKAIKTESGSHDSGWLNSSGQDLQKAAEPAAVQKENPADQAGLRNQTIDQIVRKAAIHLRNGQQEAQIDLKPDFLGHIRMQVISANHQVTVRILAEHGFVKDMIESNIHQLKADLNQQGLEVDKLEVTVSRDPEDSGNYKDKLAQSRARPGNADRQNDERPAKEKKQGTAPPARAPNGTASVDYFA